ncbi:MAG TPA: DUF899 family protein [Desertimonas sp.]|nr:DUF899 family protein [Desertimonas sp.]
MRACNRQGQHTEDLAAVRAHRCCAHQDHPPDEAPGSAFALHDGTVFHTYSSYSRGLDPINDAYQLLDLTPTGRDEAGLDWPMAWLRRHDAYDDRAPWRPGPKRRT